jgi:UDP-N-acetylglucosamine diphosphorylase/glucosamine-1-phosphate N-acetyltransferase
LRIGILTIGEKWESAFKQGAFSRITRAPLRALFTHGNLEPNSSTIWVNSRYLPSDSLVNQVKNLDIGTCIKHQQSTVAAHVAPDTTQQWLDNGEPNVNSLLVVEGQELKCITNLWDLFLMNDEEIKADINRVPSPEPNAGTVSDSAVLENRDDIHIAGGAEIQPGVILMAQDGPIYIGKNATIMAGSIIQGPTAICEGATVKMGAKIYHGTTIGPVCKVGGEINNSIFHSYSNKGHDGFLGNSLIGQWCNLGADTNTSNLKNNYSSIRITDWSSRKEIETGQQFLGTVMGDHSKTAINTQLNTGTLCGVSCNIFSGDFPPKFIPSFSWVGSNVIQPYRIDKALETMVAMMKRRNVELSNEYETLMRDIFSREHN